MSQITSVTRRNFWVGIRTLANVGSQQASLPRSNDVLANLFVKEIRGVFEKQK